MAAQQYPNRGGPFSRFDKGERFEFEAMPTCCGCNEMGNCCKALWCPCFRTAEIMTATGMWSPTHPSHGNCSKNIHIWTGCCYIFHCLTLYAPALAGVAPPESAGAFAAVGGIIAAVGKLCFLWPIVWMRQQFGGQFNIPVCEGAGCLTDCCCPWYCWCWTMNQEFNTGKKLMAPDSLVGTAIEAGLKVVKAAL